MTRYDALFKCLGLHFKINAISIAAVAAIECRHVLVLTPVCCFAGFVTWHRVISCLSHGITDIMNVAV
jgi:hypothetical protein